MERILVIVIETEEKLLRYGRWVVKILAVFTGGVFFVVTVGGLVTQTIESQLPDYFKNVCFPLGDPNSVVADEKGQIYVGLGLYNRVQVYDQIGEFLFGFHVKRNFGAFQLRWDSEGRLNVVTARGNELYVYDSPGSLISLTKVHKELYSATRADNRSGFVDENGNRYRIERKLSSDRVIKTDSEGQVILQIQSPLLMGMFTLPFNLFLLGVLNPVMWFTLLYLKTNCRRVVDGTHLFPNGIIRRNDVLIRHKRRELDVILTKQGVCWAKNVWKSYECIAMDDLDIRIKKRWVGDLVIIKSESSLSMKDVRFQANNPGKWISTVEKLQNKSLTLY